MVKVKDITQDRSYIFGELYGIATLVEDEMNEKNHKENNRLAMVEGKNFSIYPLTIWSKKLFPYIKNLTRNTPINDFVDDEMVETMAKLDAADPKLNKPLESWYLIANSKEHIKIRPQIERLLQQE